MSRGREKLWVVRPQDGTSLVAIVKRAGEDERALAEGRVFIGKHRVSAERQVKVGEAIRIYALAPTDRRRDEAARAEPPISILFDREGVVACIKPSGLPTVPDHQGAAHSLVARVEKQTGRSGLRVTSRLDREVSGVVLFATDDASEARLRDARGAGAYARRYVAIAAPGTSIGVTTIPPGTWDAPIGRARDPLLRAVDGPEAKAARTRWRVAGGNDRALLLGLDPETGRTHQIRVHSAHAGWPLFGDRDYGGPTKVTLRNGTVIALARIALHCARVQVAGLEAEAPIPDELTSFWQSVGGDSRSWEDAVMSR